MTKQTLQLIHDEYVSAVKTSRDILGITKCLHENLSALSVLEEDTKQFDSFLAGLLLCIRCRERTNDFTSLMEGITTTIVYIIIFMNNRKNTNWDINIIARRKALERDLCKILRKVINEESPRIRDRFGACIVLSNEIDFIENQLYDELYSINDTVQGILCGTNRQLRKDFFDFISDIRNPLIKPQIDIILQLPFCAEHFKDYIAHPSEDTGYQSLHVCLRIDAPALFFSGAIIELQIRSKTMNDNAIFGKWNHSFYEQLTSSELADIFHVPTDLFNEINIPNFTSYTDNGDVDGIGTTKFFLKRRASSSLIPQYK